MAEFDVSVSTSAKRSSGEMEEQMGAASDSGIAHQPSEYVTAFDGGLLSSNCTPNAEDMRAYGMWLEQEQRQCKSEEEFVTAISKPAWTEVAPLPSSSAVGSSSSSTEGSSSCMSFAEKCAIRANNEQFFQELIKKQPPHERKPSLNVIFNKSELGKILEASAFFTDFEGRLEVGKKIAEGSQAEIYEVLFDGKMVLCDDSPEDSYLLKVVRLERSEWFQLAWANEFERIYKQFNELRYQMLCCFVRCCTLLNDGRFAFLMERYWGDLRKAINVQILKNKIYIGPPFPPSISTNIIYQIAIGMRMLHCNDILHKDLKANNVLVTPHIEKCMRLSKESRDFLICHVTDFESANGVLGTRFWRAPEVLGILRSSAKNKDLDPTIWTKKVDVYAYGMTCYEVLTGCIPFQTRAAYDYNIGDERPPLPDYVDEELQELLKKCWNSEPSKRPSFEIICNKLARFSGRKIKHCKALAEDDRDDDAKRWLTWPWPYIDESGAQLLGA